MDAVSGQDHAAAADTALHRLATYGTLRPGHLNDHQLDGLRGRWLEGYVNGRLVDEGWGASLGFPALILDSEGSTIRVPFAQLPMLGSHAPNAPPGSAPELPG